MHNYKYKDSIYKPTEKLAGMIVRMQFTSRFWIFSDSGPNCTFVR